MSDERVIVGGEVYVRVETVAELYRVEPAWLVEVVEADLLGDGGVVAEPTLCIAAARLDRVATIVRLHVLGLDVDAIRLALEGPSSR